MVLQQNRALLEPDINVPKLELDSIDIANACRDLHKGDLDTCQKNILAKTGIDILAPRLRTSTSTSGLSEIHPNPTVQAFSRKFVDKVDLIGRLHEHLLKISNSWDRMVPYTTITQSSGYGKSRAMKELAWTRKTFVVYVCLRDTSSSGYPYRSSIADRLLESERRPEDIWIKFVSFHCACLHVLAQYIVNPDMLRSDQPSSTPGSSETDLFGSWFQVQLVASPPTYTVAGMELWVRVMEKMDEMTQAIEAHVPQSTEQRIGEANPVFSMHLQRRCEAAVKAYHAACRKSEILSNEIISPLVVFASDEARAYAPQSSAMALNQTHLHYHQSSLGLFPAGSSIVGVYISVFEIMKADLDTNVSNKIVSANEVKLSSLLNCILTQTP
ncbi:hypothetical protein HK102_004047 [Quaeritorhiza haematococci]|nr:hypothetical protein HK102_004047 [Quaeritorhiza haematococci]